mmetsp:Transcript_28013/g.39107  ORF Transcript_28013/g.39107 Transcript_28013/m.39107 type:complete len:203 (-) Transcript_28013:126-734(-)
MGPPTAKPSCLFSLHLLEECHCSRTYLRRLVPRFHFLLVVQAAPLCREHHSMLQVPFLSSPYLLASISSNSQRQPPFYLASPPQSRTPLNRSIFVWAPPRPDRSFRTITCLPRDEAIPPRSFPLSILPLQTLLELVAEEALLARPFSRILLQELRRLPFRYFQCYMLPILAFLTAEEGSDFHEPWWRTYQDNEPSGPQVPSF